MEVLLGFGIIGCIIALVVWSRRRTAAQRAAKMSPYLKYWSDARQKGEVSLILDAGKKLVEAARWWDREMAARYASEAYRTCLPLLREHPDFKPHLLELGRAAYGWPRTDGRPTVYDEQAIANDITAHS
ncbi:MAG TPA: hypothetical protein VKM72_33465 [Thermoanaerobaculia bacterium]|nr:hypothetical protein [Thermoanaerobaculia bacterium]